MPKIIFRPNPVPPPFPPPGPVYPPNSIELSPYPFNVGDDISGIIHNLTLPSGYEEYVLCYYVPSESQYILQGRIEYAPFIETLTFDIFSDYDSSDVSGFFVECYKDGEQPYYFPLTIV